jgi:molybdenum cofactor cytidylyltransferase
MNLAQALRLLPPPSQRDTSPRSNGFGRGREGVAFVGSGGKSTALFQLARELPPPVIVSATTHLSTSQIRLADSHWIAEKPEDLAALEESLGGVMLVTGPIDGDRTTGLSDSLMNKLHAICMSHYLPLLIEADGSRQKPLKAPADHEPVVPQFVETVVVVAGLSGLGKPLTEEFVHRPKIFARLSGLKLGETITSEALIRELFHPAGGLNNLPSGVRRVLLLNQADTPEIQAQARGMTDQLRSCFHAVILASLDPRSTIADLPTSVLNPQSIIHAVHESVAGIILAAGGSSRFGQPKQLLDWRGQPFIRSVADAALAAGLSPVVVVTGANAEAVTLAISNLPVTIRLNPDWQMGQSSSIQAGLRALFQQSLQDATQNTCGAVTGWEEIGAAIFLLADQPQVTPTVLRALCEEHARTLAPIVAPLVQGQRANPVLFDRRSFQDLMALNGDVGGRAIFSKFPVNYLTWHDQDLLSDVDTPVEYRKLVHGE